jgi:APA family basic amino acid/polyamine antiporter
MLSIIGLSSLLCFGIKGASNVLSFFVVVKIVVILLFIFGGIQYTNTANYQPFAPFGFTGIFKGSITVFFAYIGFDAVSTTAQEAKNPKRDLPIGILGSLGICTALYIAVCLVLSALLPYPDIPPKAAVASALLKAGGPKWLSVLIAFGGLAGLTSVLMVTLLGQPRIFRAMAYDGLFPASFAYIHPKTGAPTTTTIITGVTSAIGAAFLPIDVLANLTSVGTLLAFLLVAVSVIILRVREPNRERPFSLPGPILGYGMPIMAILTILSMLILGGTVSTIARVAIWLALGFVVYFCYGFRYSKLRHPELYGNAVEANMTEVDAGKK